MNSGDKRISRTRRAPALALCAALLGALCLVLAGGASGQDLESRLDDKQSALEHEKDRKGVLSTDLARYGDQIDQLAGEVATLRNREAIVQAELDRVQSRLRRAKDRLEVLKHQLKRSLNTLRNRLVEIYRSDEPDVLTVMLEADGFDDLISRYEYLQRISEQDASIVGRVRVLRNGTRDLVARVQESRDEIAAKKAELERTRVQLEARKADLDAARDRKATALDGVQGHIEHLEGDISAIQDKIQAQIQAASSTSTTPLPAGPIQGGSSGFIWPVNGPVSSPFGWRWGRMHEGVDISVPAGTPIRAAKAGNVILAAPTSGYGNYTCVDHGGGLSSCYAHQSSYAVGVGDSVDQGQVIGYSGCTGSCFGDHLHFEIRVDGAAVDPLGYL
ncbi:MAG: peptidoglycan DD-metalloendopeptidase family protein [Solirubrobacterales bacterium]|nr:peptidoglycan DD-metalloendopeptidase family protein [Solirubrobacterales bacterium]